MQVVWHLKTSVRWLLQFQLCVVEFVVLLLGFPSLSWFLHSSGESGPNSWSFVPGYGMVKQACDVMQLHAYVWLQAFLSFSSFSCWISPLTLDVQRIHFGHQSWNQYTCLGRGLTLAFREHFWLQRAIETRSMSYVLMSHRSSFKMEKAFSLALFSPLIIVHLTEEKSTACWC